MDAYKNENYEGLTPGTPIDLFDETGESVRFDHLATIEEYGGRYCVLTPHINDIENINVNQENDVYIMQIVSEGEENTLEVVENENLLEAIFDKFKTQMADVFDFVDEDKSKDNNKDEHIVHSLHEEKWMPEH